MTVPINTTPILITTPDLHEQGGVASFIKGVLPHLCQDHIIPLQIGGTKGWKNALSPLADQIRFRRKVITVKPTLIHLNPSLDTKSFIRDGLFAWQAKQIGYPLLVFWHGWSKSFEDQVSRKYMWFFRKTFGRADGFIVLASAFKKTLRDWGITATIYQGTTCVDDDLTAGFDAEKKWDTSEPISPVKLLFLARLERAKGVFETVQAVKFLVEKKNPVRLTIAGDGNIRQELENYTRSLHLTPQQVNFTGDIRGKDKIRVFAEHHIYCLPSYYGEGLPTSVLEAMSFGMPVVTRPVGGLSDIFKDGKMGALVEIMSPKAISMCLEQLIGDQQKMAKIGRYNANYAKDHFMASVVAERLSSIYQELIDCRR